MPAEQDIMNLQIDQICEAMKKAGVWSNETPEWFMHYQEGPMVNIWQWLQFIHLPMRMNGTLQKPQYLAPRLSAFMQKDPLHRHILQLVIELDSITSTLQKS